MGLSLQNESDNCPGTLIFTFCNVHICVQLQELSARAKPKQAHTYSRVSFFEGDCCLRFIGTSLLRTTLCVGASFDFRFVSFCGCSLVSSMALDTLSQHLLGTQRIV